MLGDRNKLAAGSALVGVGTAAMGAGGLVLLWGLIFRSTSGGNSDSLAQNDRVLAAGTVVAAVGIATLVGGIACRREGKNRLEIIPGKLSAVVGAKGVGLFF